MKVSMVDINKKPNQIINKVVESGESAIIMKHGKAIAEIRPIANDARRRKAIDYLVSLEPVKVSTPLEDVIAAGRKRGI
ncbi:MAG: hypothetical protein AAGI44_20380 [Pseudomonadota bacterium]